MYGQSSANSESVALNTGKIGRHKSSKLLKENHVNRIVKLVCSLTIAIDMHSPIVIVLSRRRESKSYLGSQHFPSC